MNYTNINNLSMTGGDDFSDINLILDNVVLVDTTQTITGNKLISGTTTFTGDIVANGFTITPTELGFLDGLTSNAQTQINSKANDADVVHKTDSIAETITGEKRFTDDVLIQPTGNTTDTQLKITGNFNTLDFKKSLAIFSNVASGGSNDYGAYVGNSRENFGNFLIGRYHNNAIVGGIFDPAFRIDWTDFTTNAGIIQMLQPFNSTVGGLERISVSSTDTVINNDRVYIKNGGNTRIEVNSNGDTTLNNTDNIILKSNGNTKYYNSTIANYHINDAHYIRNIDNTITYASFDGANNIISNVGNQITASGTNTLSAVNNTITATSGTNTINGATAITGTTTITGNIIANALTITPTELGYLDGATSNLQTQITARVSKTGNITENIDGLKTFTNTLTTTQEAYFTRNTFTYDQYIRLGAIANFTFLDYRSGGNSTDYDVRCSSSGGNITPTPPDNNNYGYGNYAIEAGTTTLDTKTTNTIKSGGVAKITTTTDTNTLTNTNNTIQTSAVSGANTMYASGGLGVNLLWAGGTSGYNWLYAQGTGAYNLIQTTGTGTNTIQSDANTSGTANYIKANGAGGGNRMETGAGGVNRLEGYDTNSSNLLAVNGSTKIQTTNSTNTINNTTNILSVSGQSKITTTSSTNTITNQVNNITATAGSNTITASSGNVNNLAVDGVNKLTVGASIIAINPTDRTTINTDGAIKIDVISTRTTLTNGVVDVVGSFISPSYYCGTFSSNTFLSTGVIFANQSTTSLSGGGSVPMSIGGFARTTFSIQQGVLPINVVFFGCAFMSDNANQTTARRITLEMTGVDRYYVDVPTGANYRSLVGTPLTSNWALPANNGYYLQIKSSGTSTTAKDWNIALYYYQY
jgi:hypothetical protein